MFTTKLAALAVAAGLLAADPAAQAQSFNEGFNGADIPAGWVTTNLSSRASLGYTWSAGPGITNDTGTANVVSPFEGDGMAVVNFNSIGSGSGTINNWLISPLITGLDNGDTFSFYTSTKPGSAYPDRLEFRLSTSGASTDVGSSTTSVGVFTTTLLTINPTLAHGGYPEVWTQYTVTLSGLPGPTDGRAALRYFVTSAGPGGSNSNAIAVDAFSYTALSAVPEAAPWTMLLAGMGVMALVRRGRQGLQA